MRTFATRALALRLALAAMMTLLPLAAPVAHAQGQGQGQGRPATGLAVPITGTVTGLAGTAGAVPIAGTLTIQRFAEQGGVTSAVGTFVGTVTDAAGTVQNIVSQVTMAVSPNAATASCEILNLVLGPLDLNLLGLQVHLDQVVLDITAVPGAGNLLGNLLCAVAGLLDGPNTTGLAGLLNQVLGILG